MVQIKRIYDGPSADDGVRVLVDRLWPRGISKDRAALDEWMKDVAPSPSLRDWFGHKPKRFKEFEAKYLEELASNIEAEKLKELIRNSSKVTLLYAAHDPEVNHARVLLKFLNS